MQNPFLSSISQVSYVYFVDFVVVITHMCVLLERDHKGLALRRGTPNANVSFSIFQVNKEYYYMQVATILEGIELYASYKD